MTMSVAAIVLIRLVPKDRIETVDDYKDLHQTKTHIPGQPASRQTTAQRDAVRWAAGCRGLWLASGSGSDGECGSRRMSHLSPSGVPGPI
jgi:hypothetical protein